MFRGQQLFPRFHGKAHDGVRSHETAGVFRGQIALSHVQSGGSRSQGYVGPVVDERNAERLQA